VLGLVDEESDLWDAVSESGRLAVIQLTADERLLADQFAGVMPAPGGLFRTMEWTATPYGPVPAGQRTWAGCLLDRSRPCGWGLLVEATIETITFGDDAAGVLAHLRGRYLNL
jgi:3-hydroxy-9,10-secoandrosta-1,3,5(10)-triene-9,17-dione monooxygenase reductase component